MRCSPSFGSIEWRVLGYSDLQIGAFWAFGIVCEVSVFIWSTAALRRFGPFGLIVIGGLAAIVRWSLFPLNPGFLGFALLQGMHGLTFGANYAGVQHLIARAVPERMTASAQGIYAMITGVLLAGATFLTGPIYHAYGIYGFLFMVPIPIVALIVLFSARRFAAV